MKYTVGHKKPIYFVRNFVKNQHILMQFSIRFKNERHILRYVFHPPHIINAATLRCESQNTKNGILQQDIPKKIASDVS